MTSNAPVPAALIPQLSQLGDLRVWSVIITIFGDAVMPRGGTVSASTLSAITDRLKIKPEALRVALYRLAKDGWVTRSKVGRNSFYGLSDSGRAEFLPATLRIYAGAPQLSGPWRLVGLPSAANGDRAKLGAALAEAGFLSLTPGLFLGAGLAGDPPPETVVLSGNQPDLPDWARAALAPKALQADYARLAGVLADMHELIADWTDPDPLDAVALRTLLIHQWRRVLLRHADLPLEVLPRDWQGESCRTAVLNLHRMLSPHTDPWLDAAIGPVD